METSRIPYHSLTPKEAYWEVVLKDSITTSEKDISWKDLDLSNVHAVILNLPNNGFIAMSISDDDVPLQWKNAVSSLNTIRGPMPVRVVSRVIGRRGPDGIKRYFIVDEETLKIERMVEACRGS